MNSKLLLLVISSVLFSACAKRKNFDSSRLFIKTTANTLPDSPLIQNSKELFDGLYLVETQNPDLLQKQLLELKNITYVKRNYYLKKIKESDVSNELAKVSTDPIDVDIPFEFNDPLINKQWYLDNETSFGSSIIEGYKLKNKRSNNFVTVAIIDTGIDYEHEDLKENLWINKGEIPNNNIDDDKNGYVDDVHGISTINRDANGKPRPSPLTPHFHGTHIAGTIAAIQNNDIGIFGVASQAKIMSIESIPSDDTDETDADLVESLLYAAKNGAKLINCSFGKDENDDGTVVNETINHIGKKYNSLVVAAAGNEFGRNIDTDPAFPASFDSPYILVVTSSNRFNRLSRFSNVGELNVDLAAPGERIFSTTPNNTYKSFSGTSMSAPIVTGIAAEILSREPKLTNLELKEILLKSTVPLNEDNLLMQSSGRLNFLLALEKTESFIQLF